MSRAWPSVFLLCALAGCASAPADLVLIGGDVRTLDDARPRAGALAVRDGRLVAVGDEDDVRALIGPNTRVIALSGETVLPGIVEAHGHFTGLGQRDRIVDLRDCADAAAMVATIVAAATTTPDGAWIEGRGWDQNRWPGAALPDRLALDAALPRRPAVLTRIDGHAVLANGAALAAAGIDADTPDPEGGEILRLPDGRPSGLLVDNAVTLLEAARPADDDAVLDADLVAAQRRAFEHGITSFHDAGTDWRTVARMRALMEADRMALRLYVMIGGSGTTSLSFGPDGGRPVIAACDHRLTVRTFKLGIDGALGSRGAALLEDYADRPGHAGLLLLDEERLIDLSRRALDAGWQVAVHAIGDRGNRMVLDAWSRLAAERPALRDARFRVEHAQIVHPDDQPRFGALGLVASVQTCHATSDLPWADERLGARVDDAAYPWRALVEGGARLCNGTDCPVEDVDPFANMQAAVRRDWGEGAPRQGFHAAQRLTREEALEAATVGGAWAAFEEDEKGRLAPGMLGDFIVVDRDPLTCPEDEIGATRVLLTVVGGRVVHDVLTSAR